MASREDDLLTKLKNCIGTLPSQSPALSTPFKPAQTAPQITKPFSYPTRQMNPRAALFQPDPLSAQSLLQSQRSTTYPEHRLRMQELVFSGQVGREGTGPRERYSKCWDQNKIKPQTQIKQQLTQRYSLSKRTVQSGMSEMRKPLLLSSTNRNAQTLHLKSQTIKENIDFSALGSYQRREKKEQESAPAELVRPVSKRQSDKEQKQERRPLPENGKTRVTRVALQGQCSALQKLKKISELNEKINERIRNIITVFQDHK